jgi:hypothetical protein
MSVLHERVEALEKVGAGVLADQALLKLVRLHLQKYEKHLTEVQKELEPFEQQLRYQRYSLSPVWFRSA